MEQLIEEREKEVFKDFNFLEKFRLVSIFIKRKIMGEYKDISFFSKILTLFVFFYISTPMNLIPNYTPFIGIFDDLILVLFFSKIFKKEVEKFIIWEQKNKKM